MEKHQTSGLKPSLEITELRPAVYKGNKLRNTGLAQ